MYREKRKVYIILRKEKGVLGTKARNFGTNFEWYKIAYFGTMEVCYYANPMDTCVYKKIIYSAL